MSAASDLRTIAAIAGVEIRRQLRDRLSFLFVLVLPVAIITVIGSASFGADDGLPIALVIETDGPVADAIASSPLVDVDEMDDRRDLEVAVRLEDVAGGVVVDGRDVTLVVDLASADAVATRTAVLGIIAAESRVLGIADTLDVSVEQVRAIAADVGRTEVVRTTVGDETVSSDEVAANDFGYTAPANLVLFTFLNSLAIGAGLAAGKQLGVYQRWRAAPVTRRSMILGLLASRFVFAAAQAGLILVIGAVVFDVDWGAPLGVAVLVALLCLVSTGAGVLAGVLGKTPEQTSSVAVPLGIGLGMLGGCMWSLDVVPSVMRTIGHLTPHAWTMDAFLDLIHDDAGLIDIGTELLVLAGFGVALVALAVRAVDRRLI